MIFERNPILVVSNLSRRSSRHARSLVFSSPFLSVKMTLFSLSLWLHAKLLWHALPAKTEAKQEWERRFPALAMLSPLFPCIRLGKSPTDLRQCLARVVVRIPYRPTRLSGLIETTKLSFFSLSLFPVHPFPTLSHTSITNALQTTPYSLEIPFLVHSRHRFYLNSSRFFIYDTTIWLIINQWLIQCSSCA